MLPRLAEGEETLPGDASPPNEGRGLSMSQVPVALLVPAILRSPAPRVVEEALLRSARVRKGAMRDQSGDLMPAALLTLPLPLGSGPGFGRTSGRCCRTRREGFAVTGWVLGPKLPSSLRGANV